MKLFTVGPVACYPGVLEAMGRQMVSHRSKEYISMHYETVEQMQEMLETKNSVYLFSSSGTGFMEAAIKNCVAEKMIVCINGSFGKRFPRWQQLTAGRQSRLLRSSGSRSRPRC